jgi:trimethylamine:corrinoid methyltransferase-like protein
MKRGGTTMEARAAKVVDEILAQHTVEPLSEEVQAGIKQIVAREQAWINTQD